MLGMHPSVLLIFDDRELVHGDVRNIVGVRRFGDIIFKRRSLFEHFSRALPVEAGKFLYRLQTDEDLLALRSVLESCHEDAAVCITAGRAGFAEADLLSQLIQRLPYAEEDFTDRLYNPLFVYLRNAHSMIALWNEFVSEPVHLWRRPWKESQRLQSLRPLDLGEAHDFLLFMSGSTATRYFNEVSIDSYHYIKRSRDKKKMQAEYLYYGLVPERMRPWLVETFDFIDEGSKASYKMPRYYLADAALQWIHGAFDQENFAIFLDRILFFVADRPQRTCDKKTSTAMAEKLFVSKTRARIAEFLAMDNGERINQIVKSISLRLDVHQLLDRYIDLYQRHEKSFSMNYAVIGHGDPCLSNVLYDQQRYLLKLLDPKGALAMEDLWTHPLYDLSKISHSILGDYDFINNGLYKTVFSERNDLILQFPHADIAGLKNIFIEKVAKLGYDFRSVRLGEASLFLSMLPLHIDYPNKVIAFILKASSILDEIENG